MDISVIIVNYNVRHFLEQCLHSVINASKHQNVEIIVVDNNSVDGSAAMLEQKFPSAKVIVNKENVGFSKANNQAIKIAKGKYILLLNPDTVVNENTFDLCFKFMEEHPEGGALTVKMIDGKGHFLPESKRALPTPKVAFYKIFGLSKLFPHSKEFGRDHLGHLNKDETNSIEILPGAFMFIRKEALDKVGLLDETFFMYGEDIDLSYRILKGGYKNYYYPETTIIHYKGESTKKGSINYVMVFYKAMIIFAQKHFSKKNASLYSFIINMAIYFRASISIIKRFVTRWIIPVSDSIALFYAFKALLNWWEVFYFGFEDYYSKDVYQYFLPAYIVIWIVSIWFLGGYRKPIRPIKSIRGLLFGTAIILLVYAMLPESFRFSRALILIGAISAIIITLFIRFMFGLLKISNLDVIWKTPKKRIIIIAERPEADRIKKLVEQINVPSEIVGYISPASKSDEGSLGSPEQINDIISINKANEIIFGSESVKSGAIMSYMLELANSSIEFKIAPPESISIIGSNSVNTAGDLYTINIDSIGKFSNKRKK